MKLTSSYFLFLAALLACADFSSARVSAGEPPTVAKPEKSGGVALIAHGVLPLWTTSSRLLKLGESIEFKFRLPPGVTSGGLKIHPQYLEQASPGSAFKLGGDLKWLESLPSEQPPLAFSNGQAALTYTPKKTGSYLVEWRAGAETYYRYFSVIDDTYIVLSFSNFFGLDPQPNFHGMGIPLDYRYPIAKFATDDPGCRQLLEYNRVFGDLVVPAFPDMHNSTHEERVRVYGEGMARARALLPDPLDHRSIRVDMLSGRFAKDMQYDPGYPRAFAEIGVNDHNGLWSANVTPWIGMPEFPYYSSPEDSRKVNQQAGGEVVAHQWDFCGSFHFLGPVDWHYAASEGRFEDTKKCLTDGMDELQNLSEMNGRPAFSTPLYAAGAKSVGEIPSSGLFPAGSISSSLTIADIPNPVFQAGDDRRGMTAFLESYLRLVAFELTKKYKLVFTRSIDMVDYYRRHFNVTPRTVFVSKTKHQLYDAWWSQGSLNNYGVVYAPERIPWSTWLTTVQKMRETAVLSHKQIAMPYKDPLSCEYILVEDQKKQMRFERECPNPIWWFDYTREERTANGSVLKAIVIPDVQIQRAQSYDKDTGITITLTMKTQASIPGYAIALWGMPIDYKIPAEDISTTAQSYTLVKNNDGETHLVLDFDLKPDAVVVLTLRKPKAAWWDW